MLGKTRREEIRTLVDDYVRRIERYAEIEITELRDGSPAALRKLKIEPGAVLVLLDAGGKQFTSQQFARWVGDLRDRGTRELVFLCGDAEGFPERFAPAQSNKYRFRRSPCRTNLPAWCWPSRFIELSPSWPDILIPNKSLRARAFPVCRILS